MPPRGWRRKRERHGDRCTQQQRVLDLAGRVCAGSGGVDAALASERDYVCPADTPATGVPMASPDCSRHAVCPSAATMLARLDLSARPANTGSFWRKRSAYSRLAASSPPAEWRPGSAAPNSQLHRRLRGKSIKGASGILKKSLGIFRSGEAGHQPLRDDHIQVNPRRGEVQLHPLSSGEDHQQALPGPVARSRRLRRDCH